MNKERIFVINNDNGINNEQITKVRKELAVRYPIYTGDIEMKSGCKINKIHYSVAGL